MVDSTDSDPDAADGGVEAAIVPDFVRRRYAVKFALGFLAVVIVVAAVGAWGYVQTQELTRADAEEELTSTAELQADALDEWVVGMRAQTRLIASHPELQDRSNVNTEVDAFLQRAKNGETISRLTGDVVNIHYVNARTYGIEHSTSMEYRGESASDLGVPWGWMIKEAASYNRDSPSVVAVSDTAYERNSETVMAFASPIPDSNYVIVVVGSIETRVGELTGPQTSTVVLNQNGGVVLEPEDGAGSLADLAGSGAFQQASQGEVTLDDHDDQIVAHAPVESVNWVAVTTTPKSSVYAVSRTVGQNVGLIVAGALLSLLVVGVVLGRQTAGPLAELRDRAEAMEEGNLDVDLRTARVDEIGRLYASFASMRDSLRETIREARTARIDAEEARQEAEEMSRHLEERATEYSEIMERAAEGDLTRRLEPDGRNAAMDQIAEDFNEMMSQLEQTIGQLRSFADEVGDSGEAVLASSEAVRDASEEVAESVQTISTAAADQADQLDAISEEIEDIRATLSDPDADVDPAELADRIDEVAREAAETAALVDETTAEAENVAAAAEEQTATLTEVSETARDLKRYVGPLGDVLKGFETETEREFFFPVGPGTEDEEPDLSRPGEHD